MKYANPLLQRVAVWCEAAEELAEIPPGVAFLKIIVGKDGSARESGKRWLTL